jgi:hypothetical protein
MPEEEMTQSPGKPDRAPAQGPPRRPPAARARLFALAAATALLALTGAAAAGQTGTIHGEIRDAQTGFPVEGAVVRVAGLYVESVSTAEGGFHLRDLPAGRLTLQVAHLGYGAHSVAVEVARTGVTAVLIELSDSAIALTPIEVEALSAAERLVRGAGFRRNLVTREQLAELRGMNLSFSDVLRQAVPGIRIRTAEGIVGASTCVELRSAAASRTRCLSPAVFLDGVPVMDVSAFYANLPLEMIESIEVVPAAEAGGRFGSGALYGALLIQSRRPGGVTGDRLPHVRSPFHDWGAEGRRHPTARSLGAAAVGNGAGLLAGLAVAETCITTRAPSHDRLISNCPVGTTVGAIAAALVLPAAGGALGARIGGQTRESRGRLFPAIAGGGMAIVPAYAMVLTGKRLDSESLRAIGIATALVGAPVMNALADHQFRAGRRQAPPPD